MLRAHDIFHSFHRRGPLVLDGVSLSVAPGRRLALTGASGCGKTTLAQIMSLTRRPSEGTVEVDGTMAPGFGLKADPVLRRQVQLLWQSPVEACDPRLRLREVIMEAVRLSGGEGVERMRELANRVGLSAALLERYPHEVSAGQLQRACTARMLACRPKYLIADEPTAMLDASSQAGILRVIDEAVEQDDLGVLLITHDLNLANHWSDEVLAFRELPRTAPQAS